MTAKEIEITCPLPAAPEDRITLAHGGGGRLMHRLLRETVLPEFADEALAQAHDGALLALGGERLAFTTDSFVVNPLFFPGGDIGSLSVYGTANDLAMCGAEPLFLSCGFILEEGFEVAALRRVVRSMRQAASSCGARIVTGDTKVVERGKGDGLYVNTSGVGRVVSPALICPSEVHPGDAVILSGDVGAHAAAILSVREGLRFETALLSDCAALWPQVRSLIEADVEIHCLRDLTRGGLATALNEIAQTAQLGVFIHEEKVPVQPEVQGACEMMGMDPLYMACEGRFIAFVPQKDAEKALACLRRAVPDQSPIRIGLVTSDAPGQVRMVGRLGVERLLDMLAGEQLPRIC